MDTILSLAANPVVWKVLAAYWIFSAFAGALPTPERQSGKNYIFIFRFVHALAGNLHRAAVTLKVLGVSTDASIDAGAETTSNAKES